MKRLGVKSLKDLIKWWISQGPSLAGRERLDPKFEGVVDGPLWSCLQAQEGFLCYLQELTSHKQGHEETVNVYYAVGSQISSLHSISRLSTNEKGVGRGKYQELFCQAITYDIVTLSEFGFARIHQSDSSTADQRIYISILDMR